MEQQYNIRTTFDKMSLINNVPVQFSINDRRVIEFRFPTIRESLGDINFSSFLGIILLTPAKVKEKKLDFGVIIQKQGDIIQGLVGNKDHSKLIVPYLLRYIKDAVFKENAIYVNEEKVMSYEFDYIVDKLMISMSQKSFVEDDEKEKENTNPTIAKILEAQRESEEKLKKSKSKKSTNNLTIEQIMLAVGYEFGISQKDLLESNYFSLIWYFSYVGKVDSHKLNQMILSSGLSKQKSYSYWLNK
jgi:glutamyl/glutaminyl-tRNA synthetase